jgi:hypothetical protein
VIEDIIAEKIITSTTKKEFVITVEKEEIVIK